MCLIGTDPTITFSHRADTCARVDYAVKVGRTVSNNVRARSYVELGASAVIDKAMADPNRVTAGSRGYPWTRHAAHSRELPMAGKMRKG